MPEARTYAGGCHCGAVRYEATTDLARVRCLDGVAPDALAVTKLDGRSL